MTGRLHVAPAGIAHAALLARLHALAYADPAVSGPPWDEAAWLSLLPGPGVFCRLAVQDGQPVGAVLARVAADEAEILTIGVVPEGRRAGVGRSLIAAAAAEAERRGAGRLFLEVAETNAAARALYQRCGFARIGRRPGYYRLADGAVAALVLAAPLPLVEGTAAAVPGET